jgi:hypothetical protein
MTYEQYWDGASALPAYYRKAEQMKQERTNQELWLQGAYFYEAICRASPILHAFAKKGAKPKPYLSEPFTVSEKQAERNKGEQARKTFEKGKRFMEKFLVDTNKKFERK